MISGLFLLAARQGFFEDLLLPGVVIIIVFALIGNSLLKHWGFEIGF